MYFCQPFTGTFATLWKFGKDKLLFAGTLTISHDAQYELLENNALKLKNVRKNDTGVYTCTLSSNEAPSVDYHVTVKEGSRPIPPPTLSHGRKTHDAHTHGSSRADRICQIFLSSFIPLVTPLVAFKFFKQL